MTHVSNFQLLRICVIIPINLMDDSETLNNIDLNRNNQNGHQFVNIKNKKEIILLQMFSECFTQNNNKNNHKKI